MTWACFRSDDDSGVDDTRTRKLTNYPTNNANHYLVLLLHYYYIQQVFHTK